MALSRASLARSARWLATLAFALAPTLAAQQPAPQGGALTYPPAPRDTTVDVYFGTRVADPYRWMEDLASPVLARWIAAENALTQRYLAAIPFRDSLRARLTQLSDYAKTGLPVVRHGRLFYRANSGLQRQSVLYMRNGITGRPVTVIDPNALSPDGSIAFQEWSVSPDARYVAYGLSQGGADWRTVRVRDVTTMRDVADTVRWMRFSSISWTRDGRGFFYARFPEPPAGRELSAPLRDQAVYYHVVGTPQASDIRIFALPELPRYFVGCRATEDGRYLTCTATPGATNRNRLYVADLGDPMHPNVRARLVPIVEHDVAQYSPIGSAGSTLYVLTNSGAPRRRVIAVDLTRPAIAAARTVVPEGKYAIEDAALAGGRIVLQYLEDVKSIVRVFEGDGRPVGAIPLPGIGTVSGISARGDTPVMFLTYTSPLVPPTVYRYDVRTRAMSAFDPPRLTFDPSRYVTDERFAISRDGTRIPLFITHRRDMVLDGSHPALLYAYGGFDISTTPGFTPAIPAWLERGGVYVTASLRGGGEYGEAWHRAGMRERKQNVFDDFIGAAEYLVRERYTSPSRLVMQGGSNGGLLIGAAANQRPDLFAVALPAVGVMDMLRYDRFTGGAAWVPEYGSSSDSTMFRYLYAYSPLHIIRPGVCYPATLATTADHDDRVVPSHTFKYIATLQAAQGCGRPVLVRVETEGSHGYRPTDKAIAETADKLAFALANLR